MVQASPVRRQVSPSPSAPCFGLVYVVDEGVSGEGAVGANRIGRAGLVINLDSYRPRARGGDAEGKSGEEMALRHSAVTRRGSDARSPAGKWRRPPDSCINIVS